MPTLDERIELATAELAEQDGHVWDDLGADGAALYRSVASAAVRAAFPELFTSPPTHWLAPWEATEKMIEAAAEHDGHTVYDQPADGETHYTAMRDSYLSEKT